MIEILDNLNVKNKYNKLNLISCVVKSKFDLFKKVGAVVLAGLSISQVLHQNLYAATNNTNSNMIVKKQENSNSKSKFVNFFKTLYSKQQKLVLLSISGVATLAIEHLVVNPIFEFAGNRFKDYDSRSFDPRKKIIADIFKQARFVVKTNKLLNNYLSAFENFTLKLYDYKKNNKLSRPNVYSFKELLDVKELELQKLLDATKKIYETYVPDFPIVEDSFKSAKNSALKKFCIFNNIYSSLKDFSDSLFICSNYTQETKFIKRVIDELIFEMQHKCQFHQFMSDSDELFKNIKKYLNIKLKDFVSPQNSKQYGDLKIQLYNFLDNYYSKNINTSILKSVLTKGISKDCSYLNDKTLKSCLLEYNLKEFTKEDTGCVNSNAESHASKLISNFISEHIFDDYEVQFSNDMKTLFESIKGHLNVEFADFVSPNNDNKYGECKDKLLKFLKNYYDNNYGSNRTRYCALKLIEEGTCTNERLNKLSICLKMCNLAEVLLLLNIHNINTHGVDISRKTYMEILNIIKTHLLNEEDKQTLEQTRELFKEIAKIKHISVSDFINSKQYDSLREKIGALVNYRARCLLVVDGHDLPHCLSKENVDKIDSKYVRCNKNYDLYSYLEDNWYIGGFESDRISSILTSYYNSFSNLLISAINSELFK